MIYCDMEIDVKGIERIPTCAKDFPCIVREGGKWRDGEWVVGKGRGGSRNRSAGEMHEDGVGKKSGGELERMEEWGLGGEDNWGGGQKLGEGVKKMGR